MHEFKPVIGQWWLPENPEHRVSGYLDYDLHDGDVLWQLVLDGKLEYLDRLGYTSGRTLHATTPRGPLTLQNAYWRGEDGLGSTTSQRWDGHQLFQGPHTTDDQLFSAATFATPHLLEWIGPSTLNYHPGAHEERPRIHPDEPLPQVTAELEKGLTLTLSAGYNRTIGRTSRSWEAHGTYGLRARDGMTAHEITEHAFHLTRLHSIIMDTPAPIQRLEMHTKNDEVVREVEPLREGPRGSHVHDPFFDTWEIDFNNFIARWLQLAEQNTNLVGMAIPKSDRIFVETRLIEACNGLEALGNLLLPEPTLTEEEEELLEKLKAQRVGKNHRRKIKRSLLNMKWPLSRRLKALALTIGDESAAWLLGPSIDRWAEAAAKVRNSLAHGQNLPSGMGADYNFIGVTERSLTLLLRLALLRQVGYTNKRSGTPGELLWARGRPATGHVNSKLFKECEAVSEFARHWEGWHARVVAPNPPPSGAHNDAARSTRR